MMTERQLHEAVARCVSIVVYYHNAKPTSESGRRMASEIGAVSREVGGQGLAPDEAEWRVVRPVERELMLRYGHKAGPRMVAEFIEAFEGVAVAR